LTEPPRDRPAAGGVIWDAVPSRETVGAEIHELLAELYPICRSISGDGVRQTLAIVSEHLPLAQTEVPTGTKVFDWTVPREWNIRDAWIAAPDGRRVVDFRESNLHVLGYSTPIRARLPLTELKERVFTHPTEPDWVPYRTSYYKENWGFCLSSNQLAALEDGEYEVCIDSTLEPGSITYGEALLEGASEREVLLSTYCCHPSLANDNVSGIAFLAILGSYLRKMELRYSYRFLFSPGSIGPIAWLARNEPSLDRIAHGLVASCLGDPGPMTYKRSRRGSAEIDRAVESVFRDGDREPRIRDFVPLGGDERQFGSPGINLPVGALSRTPADEFRGYHSSADDLALVEPWALGDALHAYLAVIDTLERNHVYVSTSPKGEPQLGPRGLYRSIGGGSFEEGPILWVLNLADGDHDLLAMAERSGLPFPVLADAAELLFRHELLER
jgi:aminopeptidase-like protein